MSSYSVLIPVYNGASTIERAVASVEVSAAEIIVVNDASTDETLSVLQGVADPRVRILSHVENRGVGASRQTALEAAKTPYILWLDADDMMLPGRADAMLGLIEAGADYVYGNAELVDGTDHSFIGYLENAAELKSAGGLAWQFARNLAPALGWPMARRDVALAAGYDSSLRHSEDHDHMFRAIRAGADIRFSDNMAYRQYHYPNSLTRQHENHQRAIAKILTGIDASWLHQYLTHSVEEGLPKFDAFQIKAMFHTQRKEWEILSALAEEWRHEEESHLAYFFIGVSAYHAQDLKKAASAFCRSLEINPSAEGWNNLGVALARQGKASHDAFQNALLLKSDYLDAKANLSGGEKFTILPLRSKGGRHTAIDATGAGRA